MLEFKEFKMIMQHFQDCENFAKELNNIFDKYNRQVDFIDGYGFIDDKANNIIIYLLEEIFDDKETQWIEYWIYELDCGKNWKPGTVTLEDGFDIKLETVEDLWNFLYTNMVDGELW